MKTLLAERLCAACNLGTLLSEPQAVTGGLLHQMWRLSTTQGVFAVKQLNPAIMRKPDIQDAYRLTEQIAADFAAQGIPAVAALTCNEDRLQHIDDHMFIVYTWIEGEVFAGDAATPEQARLMEASWRRSTRCASTIPSFLRCRGCTFTMMIGTSSPFRLRIWDCPGPILCEPRCPGC